MNVDSMPELHWAFGCPFAIVLMAVVCTGLYLIFRRRDWLWGAVGERAGAAT